MVDIVPQTKLVTLSEGPLAVDTSIGVNFAEMAHAAAVAPVLGSVGPMTIDCLLANTVRAAAREVAGVLVSLQTDLHACQRHRRRIPPGLRRGGDDLRRPRHIAPR